MNLNASTGSPVPVTSNTVWKWVFFFCFLILLVDGADLIFLSYSLKSISDEFELTKLESGYLGSATLVGMAIGGIYGGWAADRFGRVQTLMWTVIVFSVGTALLGAMNNYWQFISCRFVASLGIGAAYIVCSTLMAEYVPTARRTTILGTLQAGWSVGYVVATLLAKYIIPGLGWRWLFASAIIPVVLVIFLRKMIPEPKSWVESRMKLTAKKTTAGEQKSAQPKVSSYRMIFSDPASARMFILWALTAGFLQFGYYGVNNWLPMYLEGEIGISFETMTSTMVGAYTAMIIGKILAGVLADRFGRRTVYAAGAMGTAIFLPVIVFYHPPEAVAWMLIFFGLLYGVPYAVNATYMTESFETKIRGAAVGGAYNVGRVGAAIAPTTIGFLAALEVQAFGLNLGIGLGFLVMGVAYFLCGLVPALFIKDKQYDPQK